MDDSTNSAVEFVKRRNEAAIYNETVKSKRIFKPTQIIVISDSNIYVFKKNGKIKTILSIFEMIGMKTEQEILTLIYPKEEYQFFISENSQLSPNIIDVIRHMMTMKEQSGLQINNFQITKEKHNGLGALFKINAIYKNPRIENLKTLENILRFSQPYVSMTNFVDPINFLPYLIRVLPLCTHIKSLSFPKLPDLDIYYFLTQLCQNEINLKHIAIQGEITPNFNNFISAIKENRESKLFGLSFVDSDLKENDLNQLQSIILSSGVRSIEFHRAIENTSFVYFYSTFLSPQLFDSLYCLNLAGTTNINISQLFSRIKRIKMLCLSNCGLNITDVMMELPTFTNIKMLDLSRNRCTEPVDQSLALPPTLNSLNIDYTSFSADCIIPFLTLIFQSFEKGLKLSMASIALPNDNEWADIFSFFHHCHFRSLVSLVWDGNPIHPKFFTFLLRSPFLTSLSLNYCITSSSAYEAAMSLSLFIQSSRSISKLSIRGNQKRYIGNNIEMLLKYAQSSESLQFLDLTYSKCGDAGISQISQFLDNWSPLKELVIDGTKPKNPISFLNLLRNAARIKDRFKLSYPFNDLQKLYKKGLITDADMSEMRELYQLDENSTSFFLQPFRIYRHYLFDSFPSYLTKSEIDALNSTRPLIENLPPIRQVEIPNPYSPTDLQSPTTKRGPFTQKRIIKEEISDEIIETDDKKSEVKTSVITELVIDRSPKENRQKHSPHSRSPHAHTPTKQSNNQVQSPHNRKEQKINSPKDRSQNARESGRKSGNSSPKAQKRSNLKIEESSTDSSYDEPLSPIKSNPQKVEQKAQPSPNNRAKSSPKHPKREIIKEEKIEEVKSPKQQKKRAPTKSPRNRSIEPTVTEDTYENTIPSPKSSPKRTAKSPKGRQPSPKKEKPIEVIEETVQSEEEVIIKRTAKKPELKRRPPQSAKPTSRNTAFDLNEETPKSPHQQKKKPSQATKKQPTATQKSNKKKQLPKKQINPIEDDDDVVLENIEDEDQLLNTAYKRKKTKQPTKNRPSNMSIPIPPDSPPPKTLSPTSSPRTDKKKKKLNPFDEVDANVQKKPQQTTIDLQLDEFEYTHPKWQFPTLNEKNNNNNTKQEDYWKNIRNEYVVNQLVQV